MLCYALATWQGAGEPSADPCASFTGGLPHVTLVVGEALNLTAYESFVNWHPSNASLLLQGARRTPGLRVCSCLDKDQVQKVR